MVNAWKPILAAVVIFAAGVVTGGFVVDFGAPKPPRAFPRERGPRNAEHPPGSRMEGQLNWLMKRIQRDLKLTDEQVAKVAGENVLRVMAAAEKVAASMKAELPGTAVLPEEPAKGE